MRTIHLNSVLQNHIGHIRVWSDKSQTLYRTEGECCLLSHNSELIQPSLQERAGGGEEISRHLQAPPGQTHRQVQRCGEAHQEERKHVPQTWDAPN